MSPLPIRVVNGFVFKLQDMETWKQDTETFKFLNPHTDIYYVTDSPLYYYHLPLQRSISELVLGMRAVQFMCTKKRSRLNLMLGPSQLTPHGIHLAVPSIRLQLIRAHLLPRAILVTLVDDLLPTQTLRRIFDVLDGREVVLVLLHGRYPRHVIERHDLHAEVLIVVDFLDLLEEEREVGCGCVVDVCDKVCWCELNLLA
jgi:hypothetical protein